MANSIHVSQIFLKKHTSQFNELKVDFKYVDSAVIDCSWLWLHRYDFGTC